MNGYFSSFLSSPLSNITTVNAQSLYAANAYINYLQAVIANISTINVQNLFIDGTRALDSLYSIDQNVLPLCTNGTCGLELNPAFFSFYNITDGFLDPGWVGNIGFLAGQFCTGNNVNNFGYLAGQFCSGLNVNNLGYFAGQSCTGSNVNNHGNFAGQFCNGSDVNNRGGFAGQNCSGSYVNNDGYRAGQYCAGLYVNNAGPSAGVYCNGTQVNNFGYFAGENCTGSNVNNFGYKAGQFCTGVNVNNNGEFAGQSNTGSYVTNDGNSAGIANTYNYCHNMGRSAQCTGPNQFAIGSPSYPENIVLFGTGANNYIASATANLRLGSPTGTTLATTATTGFPKIPAIAGTPTGVPVFTESSSSAIAWDSTNKKLAVYNQPTSAWVEIGASSAGTVTSVSGTTNQIAVATGTTTPVLSIPSTFIAPGSMAATTSFGGQYTTYVSGLTATVVLGASTVIGSAPITTFGTNYGGAFEWSLITGTSVTVPGLVATFTPGMTCPNKLRCVLTMLEGSGATYDTYLRMSYAGVTTTVCQLYSTSALSSSNGYQMFIQAICL